MTGKIPDKILSPDVIKHKQELDKRLDPMRVMLKDYGDLIKNEVKDNANLKGDWNFEAIVRKPGMEDNKFVQLKSIKGEDLHSILEKVDTWVNEKNEDRATKLPPLLPREIEALSEIVKAIEKEELVIKQGSNYISQEESQIYSALSDQHTMIEKAENLAKQKFLGRGTDGQLTIADTGENLKGIYDITEDNVDLKKAFGDGKEIYDHSEFTQTSEKAEVPTGKRNYSDSFLKQSVDLKLRYTITEINKDDAKSEKSESQKGELGAQRNIAADVAKANLKNSKQLAEAFKANNVSSQVIIDTRLDNEAQLERDKEKKLEKDLDKKAALIKEENSAYDLRQENVKEEHKKAA